MPGPKSLPTTTTPPPHPCLAHPGTVCATARIEVQGAKANGIECVYPSGPSCIIIAERCLSSRSWWTSKSTCIFQPLPWQPTYTGYTRAWPGLAARAIDLNCRSWLGGQCESCPTSCWHHLCLRRLLVPRSSCHACLRASPTPHNTPSCKDCALTRCRTGAWSCQGCGLACLVLSCFFRVYP